MSNRVAGVYHNESTINPSVNTLYEEIPVILGKATTGPTEPTTVYSKAMLAKLFGSELKSDFGLTGANKILANCDKIIYCRIAHLGDKATFKDGEKVVFEAKEGGTHLNDSTVKVTVTEDVVKIEVTKTVASQPVVLEEINCSLDPNATDYIISNFDVYSQYLRLSVAEDYDFSTKDLTTSAGSEGAKRATGTSSDLEVSTIYSGSYYNNHTVVISVSSQGRVSAKIKKGTTIVEAIVEGIAGETAADFMYRFNQTSEIVNITKYPALKSCSVTLSGGDSGLNTNEDDYIGNTEMGLKSLEDTATNNVGILLVPGISDAKVVKYAETVTSTRKESLYIADPPLGLKAYQTACWAQGTGVFKGGSSITTTYSACFSPWVKDNDGYGDLVYLPPSIIVVAKMMENNQTMNIWDAAAGTTGGKIDVQELEYHMDKSDREILKSANVNPIIYNTSRGFLIFGDSTGLQVKKPMNPEPGCSLSVRRLVNHIKKTITALSIDYCFSTNDSFTWDEFKLQVDPFLRNIKDNRGLYDYKLILDETTVTADKIDALEMPAIIKLKPTRKAEVIDLGFTLYPYGVQFDSDSSEEA